MEQQVENVARLDVHRDTVVACARVGRGEHPRVMKQSFKTTTAGVGELARWLANLEVARVVMESTGVYWKCVYYGLEVNLERRAGEVSVPDQRAEGHCRRRVGGRRSGLGCCRRWLVERRAPARVDAPELVAEDHTFAWAQRWGKYAEATTAEPIAQPLDWPRGSWKSGRPIRSPRECVHEVLQPAAVLAPQGLRGLEKYTPAEPVAIAEEYVHLVQTDAVLSVFELPPQARHPIKRPLRKAYRAISRVFFEGSDLGGSAGGEGLATHWVFVHSHEHPTGPWRLERTV